VHITEETEIGKKLMKAKTDDTFSFETKNIRGDEWSSLQPFRE
jgi:hypothetical protein